MSRSFHIKHKIPFKLRTINYSATQDLIKCFLSLPQTYQEQEEREEQQQQQIEEEEVKRRRREDHRSRPPLNKTSTMNMHFLRMNNTLRA